MAEESWPRSTYNAGAVTEAEYEKLAARFSDDGIYGSPFDDTPVVAGAGLQVLIQPNFYASLRGFLWQSGSAEVPLAIASNNLTAGTRFDWIVLRLDRADWTVRAAVRQGTPAAGRPALVRDQFDTGVYEIPLALVEVPVGASSLVDANISPYPLYIGSRIRFDTGLDEPGAAPGALRWNVNGYDSFDGTRWNPVLRDTGWINLGLDWLGSWSKGGGDTCAAKLKNGIVTVKISAKRVATLGRADQDGSRLVTLPDGMRPVGHPAYGTGQFSSGDSVRLDVYTTGGVYAIFPTTDVPVGAYLRAGITFAI